MRLTLRNRILLNFVLIIAVFGLVGAAMGTFLINQTTVEEEQRRVRVDLRSAWSVLQGRLGELSVLVSALGPGRRVAGAFSEPERQAQRAPLEAVRRQFGLDFLGLTDEHGRVILRAAQPYAVGDDLAIDPYVAAALQGQSRQGFAVLPGPRLAMENQDLQERAFMAFEETPKAKTRAKTSESSGLVLMAAAPVRDAQGRVLGAIFAGTLLNRNHALVDQISTLVFEGQKLDGKPVGTVTVFQWDVRVATNVVLPNGNRAIGTRVSAQVYDRVLENNASWCDQAFVVNDWYISAYDPILDFEGKVIGILYVGVLAKKYDAIRASLWKINGALALVAALLVGLVGLIFAWRLTRSVRRLAQGSAAIAGGDLDSRVREPKADDELRDLTRGFNSMAERLKDRSQKLEAARAELESANASLRQVNHNYLEMLGFVSHELKNTLGVIFTSARVLHQGLAGPLTEDQAQLTGAISRNIEAAVAMTREYLDLTRIEKGELRMHPQDLDLVEQVVKPVLEELRPAFTQAQVRLVNHLPPSLPLRGDPALLRIVYKNLLDNAVKYGQHGGEIRLTAQPGPQAWRLEVYNQGPGLPPESLAKLFGKFVRFSQETEGKGTGLGLFICKEIITMHGGEIRANSQVGAFMNFVIILPRQEASGE